MKKIKKISTQQWIPIDTILDDGIIKINNNKYIKILKIIPINYNLKSDLEKKAILNSYKIFLKTCNFDIQILIQSCKKNLKQHILNIQENINKEKNFYLKELANNYISYIENFNLSQKSSSKNFYIIISNENLKSIDSIKSIEIIKNELKEKYFKIKECLSRCGNSVFEINEKKEILDIYNSFFNNRIKNKIKSEKEEF